ARPVRGARPQALTTVTSGYRAACPAKRTTASGGPRARPPRPRAPRARRPRPASRRCGWPGEPPGASLPWPSPLHAHHLAERVHDVHQIALRGHHRVDVLVRHGRLVDHVAVLATLD